MSSYQARRVPAFAEALDPAIRQMHSIDYRDPAQLKPGGVLLVGAGNSGAEIAMELARERPTWLSGRDTGHVPFRIDGAAARLFLLRFLFRFVFHRVLTVRTPMGRSLRRKMFTQGAPLIRVKPKDLAAAGVQHLGRIAGVIDGRPALEDGRPLDIANVIWCTGFGNGLSWIDLPIFEPGGEPRHESGIVAGEPGLYFVGLHFLHSFSSTMIHGIARDAERIAGEIERRTKPVVASYRAGDAGQQLDRSGLARGRPHDGDPLTQSMPSPEPSECRVQARSASAIRLSRVTLQPHHGAASSLVSDRDEQLSIRDRDAEGDTPIEVRNQRADERAINRVQLQLVRSMNRFAGEPVQELPRVLVCVNDDAAGDFGCLVQPGRIGRPDVDPCVDRPGQGADGDRRLVGVRYSARERNPFGELEQVREHSCDEMILRFGRMTGDAQCERFVYGAIAVGEFDVEIVDRRLERHATTKRPRWRERRAAAGSSA